MARLPQATQGLRPVRPGAISSQGLRPWRGLRPLHPHLRPLHAISDHYTPIRDHFTQSPTTTPPSATTSRNLRPLHAICDHYTPICDHFTQSGSDGMTCGGEDARRCGHGEWPSSRPVGRVARLPQATRGLRPVRPGATSSQGRRPWRGLRPPYPGPRAGPGGM